MTDLVSCRECGIVLDHGVKRRSECPWCHHGGTEHTIESMDGTGPKDVTGPWFKWVDL